MLDKKKIVFAFFTLTIMSNIIFSAAAARGEGDKEEFLGDMKKNVYARRMSLNRPESLSSDILPSHIEMNIGNEKGVVDRVVQELRKNNSECHADPCSLNLKTREAVSGDLHIVSTLNENGTGVIEIFRKTWTGGFAKVKTIPLTGNSVESTRDELSSLVENLKKFEQVVFEEAINREKILTGNSSEETERSFLGVAETPESIRFSLSRASDNEGDSGRDLFFEMDNDE